MMSCACNQLLRHWKRIPLVIALLIVTGVAQAQVQPVLNAQQATAGFADSDRQELRHLMQQHCVDCHANGQSEGGFAIEQLDWDLARVAVFDQWETIHDRIESGEMPPTQASELDDASRQEFVQTVATPLFAVHAHRKGTVLRRLNRQEYENTVNDLFGTNLALAAMLPEDARSHEFDNVGQSLGLSMVHLQRYLEAGNKVLDAAIASRTEAEKVETKTVWYKDTREASTHVGKSWKLLDDGYMVRFAGGGYPSGMVRGTDFGKAGYYRITVTGYAHQSDQPIVFSIGGTSFAAGSDKPIYGFYQAPSGEPTTVQLVTWIEPRYMVQIEPYGLSMSGFRRGDPIDQYQGPGLAIGEIKVEGPLVDRFPSVGHDLIFTGMGRREIPPRNPNDRTKSWYKPAFEIVSEDLEADVRRALVRVGDQLFRRPVQPETVDEMFALFQRRVDAGDSHEIALRTSVLAMMCSPQFLFLQEKPGQLDDHALASRLAYFLHRSSPDETLRQLAQQGRLVDPNVLTQQTQRMMNSDRFARFIDDFCDNWLDLRQMDFTAPDRKLFPEYDLFLRHSMPLETKAFVRHLLVKNLPIRNLVQSDFAMLNCRLAEHYGLPELKSEKIQLVKLPPDSLRGGLLSQAAILKVTANGTNTSPVVRGVWVSERLLGKTPPPPPPGVPGVEPDIRGASTLRELLAKHRDSSNCRACHAKIDPPGFALECFNPIGGFRDRYRSLGEGDRVDRVILGRKVNYRLGPPVDASGEESDGNRFANFQEFRQLLADQDEQLARAFVGKLATFASGRELGFSDRQEVQRIVDSTAETGYRARDLLMAVVKSSIFRQK